LTHPGGVADEGHQFGVVLGKRVADGAFGLLVEPARRSLGSTSSRVEAV
jgi:hypothetical protein